MICIYLTTSDGPISGQYVGGGYLDISIGDKWNPLEAINVYERAAESEIVERNPAVVLRAMLEWVAEQKNKTIVQNIYLTNTFKL